MPHKDPATRKEYQRRYDMLHPERRKKHKKKYYETHKEEHLKRCVAWKKKNLEKARRIARESARKTRVKKIMEELEAMRPKWDAQRKRAEACAQEVWARGQVWRATGD
jgi:hypothetical protein